MGLFSRNKKCTSVSAPSVQNTEPIKLNRSAQSGLKKHPTGFYKNATKDKDGIPIASRMYWNVSAKPSFRNFPYPRTHGNLSPERCKSTLDVVQSIEFTV